MKKGFIYWLFNASQRVLYVDDNGFVLIADDGSGNLSLLKPDDSPAYLKHAPDGWKDVLIKYGRNIKYWGLFRDFTVPMKFKMDGAQIIKYKMWTEGVEAGCFLGISKLNKTIFPDKYETWYVGELDFSKFIQKKTDVTINVMEGGLSKYLKANESTTYDIPVDSDPQAIRVLLDGFPFSNKIEYEIFEGQIMRFNNTYNVGMGIISNDGSSQGVLTQDQAFKIEPAFPNSEWFFYSENKNITLNVSGHIVIHCIANGHLRVFLQRVSYPDFSRSAVFNLWDLPASGGDDIVFDFSQVVDLLPTEALYLEVETSGINAHFLVNHSSLLANYEVTFTATMIKALYPLRLLQLLVGKMTEDRYTASSTFLSQMLDWVVTSGSAIRNHEGNVNATKHGSLIKTSLADFTKSFFNRFGLGLGIENDVLIIEKIEYFFRNNLVVIQLGEVSDVSVSLAEDIMGNTVKIGQANQTYDAVNGLDEFNVTQGYTLPITKIVKELDLLSPYRADMYGIELMRLNLYGKDTTDNNSDNDTFLININRNVYRDARIYYILNRPVWDSLTGLLHPAGAFNILASPKRMLFNNGAYIHSVCDLREAFSIKFRTGEKNSELSTTLGVETITEKADIVVANLPAKLFLPYYFNFNTEVPLNLPALMKSNPYDKISFIYQGTTYTGFLWDGGIKGATSDAQTWKLLAAPDNDMTKLIDTI